MSGVGKASRSLQIPSVVSCAWLPAKMSNSGLCFWMKALTSILLYSLRSDTGSCLYLRLHALPTWSCIRQSRSGSSSGIA